MDSVYRADFHLHTHFSSDSFLSPKDMVEACLKAGLSCVAVTDHNTIQGALAVQALAPFPVIIGEEIRTSEGEIIGLFLEDEIPPGLTALETARRIHEQGGFVQIPHPFDRFRNGHLRTDALENLVPFIDAIEAFNSRTILLRDCRKGQLFGQDNDIPLTAGSDAHTRIEVGNAFIELPPFDDPQQLVDSLQHGRIHGKLTTPFIHVLTRATVLSKKMGLGT